MLILHDDEWPHDLKKTNRHKNGAPFLYADPLFVSLAIIRSMMQIPYRQMQSMTSEMIPCIPMPSYSTIFRRTQNLDELIL